MKKSWENSSNYTIYCLALQQLLKMSEWTNWQNIESTEFARTAVGLSLYVQNESSHIGVHDSETWNFQSADKESKICHMKAVFCLQPGWKLLWI